MGEIENEDNDDGWLKIPARKAPSVEAWIMLKDPFVSRKNSVGLYKVLVENEPVIGKGPTSSRIAVVDYDTTYDMVIEGAQLAKTSGTKGRFLTSSDIAKKRLRESGKKKSKKKVMEVTNLQEAELQLLEKDFHFHQTNVWATVYHTMEMLEQPDVLARKIPWAFGEGRIKILPHAFCEANAHYDRESGALCFGYFYPDREEDDEAGKKIMFTCLSHDIITHELGHAILDGLKPYYNEYTSAQTAGFHEYFGDAVAMTALLGKTALAAQVAGRDNNVTTGNSLFAKMGNELGYGVDETVDYLRNAKNRASISNLSSEEKLSEHDFSAVLTGAYFDLLIASYDHKLELILDKSNRSEANGGDRVRALISAARNTRQMLLRALDYCPPVDLQYLDYAKAVCRADQMGSPDEDYYRRVWARICDERDICLTQDELFEMPEFRNDELRNLDIAQIASSNTGAYEFIDANRERLDIPKLANFKVINLYHTNKIARNDYRVPEEIIIEFIWTSEIRLPDHEDFKDLRGKETKLFCGGTIVFSRDGNVLYYTVKSKTDERIRAFEEYVKFLIREEYMGVEAGEKGIGRKSAEKVIARLDGGKVSFTRNPAKRCQSRCGAR